MRRIVLFLAIVAMTVMTFTATAVETISLKQAESLASKDADAMLALGDYYSATGQSARAVEMYEKAGKKGNAQGYYHAGKMYIDGDLIKRNTGKGAKMIINAANAGNYDAMVEMAELTKTGLDGYPFVLGSELTTGQKETFINRDLTASKQWTERAKAAKPYVRRYEIAVDPDAENTAKYAQTDTKTLEKLAKSGDLAAMLELGDRQFKQMAGKEGKKWYDKAMDAGSVIARAKVGEWQLTGANGYKRNTPKALQNITAAATAGNLDAINMMIGLYTNGLEGYEIALGTELTTKPKVTYVRRDLKEAEQWRMKASECGDVNALSKIYNNASSSEKAKYRERAAKAGVKEALIDMGDIYASNSQYDYAKALDFYTRAGASSKISELNKTENNRYRAEAEQKKAQELARKAVAGDVDAIRTLAEKYYEEENYPLALRYSSMGADKGDTKSIFLMGELYYSGKGVEKDYEKALSYYRKNEAVNDPESIYSIGWMYAYGQGVSRNDDTARNYLNRAVKLGSKKASEALAKMDKRDLDDSRRLQAEADQKRQEAADASRYTRRASKFNVLGHTYVGDLKNPYLNMRVGMRFERSRVVITSGFGGAQKTTTSTWSQNGNEIVVNGWGTYYLDSTGNILYNKQTGDGSVYRNELRRTK